MLGTLVSSCPPHWALARRVSPSVMISLYCVRCAAIQCQLHPDQWGPLSARGRICREDNISEPFSILYAPNVILTFLKLMFIIRLLKKQWPWDWNTPATHTTLPCLSTCLLLTHDVMRWIHLHEDIYKLQENNKEGAAFVSNGAKQQNTMRYPWTKLYFSAQLHITAALVFDVKFHSSIDIESKIGGGPGPEYRTRRPGEHCGAPGCR